VDGVGQQGDRSGDQHHDQLRDRSDAERDQADLDRPDAFSTGLQGGVDRVRRIVAVRSAERQHEAP